MQSHKRLAIKDSLESSCTVRSVESEDNLSWRLASWNNLDHEFQQSKLKAQGENDLHLSVPGLWPPTMYPEIFGVSEIWLMLLSQVIRLSNEKEWLAACSTNDVTLSLQDFERHAKTLERRILCWETSASCTVDLIASKNSGAAIDVDWIALDAMLNALRYALVIYFYRRISDIEPDLLQPKVVKVKECLEECRQFVDTNHQCLQGILWSAFIAGCEAVEPDMRSWFAGWFDTYAKHNGTSNGSRMNEIMRRVWSQRMEDGRAPLRWAQLLRGT